MKYKLLVCFVIIVVLFGTTIIYSSITAKAQTREVCPTCNGTGQIPCPRCNGTGQIIIADGTTCITCGGTGLVTPKIMQRIGAAAQIDPQNSAIVIVKSTFQNMNDTGTNATVVAQLQDHQVKKNRVDFPPHEDVVPEIKIDFSDVGGPDMSSLNAKMYLTNIANVTCPICHGTGLVGLPQICPDCGGTGYITCPECGGTGYIGEDQTVPDGGQAGQASINFLLIGEAGIGVAAAVGVGMAAFMVVKKKRISEKSLRSMSASEFNTWVLNRMSGRSAASKDVSLGIDGYTASGIPIMIKQSDDIGLAAIDRFAASLARNRARNGFIVAFGYGTDAIRGKVRARMTYRLDIEMLTVSELMVSKRSY